MSGASGAQAPRDFAGRYRLGDVIRRGKSSVVHRAHDLGAGHDVALEVLDPRLTWDPDAVERLRREVIVSRRVPHEGLVRVHDLVVDGDEAAIVEELVLGESLAGLLDREGALPVETAVQVAVGILEALAACHEQGVLHRDLEPANVLLSDGRVRLSGFGVARVAFMTTLTRTGAVLGTPGYVSPEILRGARPDLRSDLHGVGLLLFEMLAGRPAFPVEPGAPFLQARAAAPRLGELRDVPEALERLVERLLQSDPESRPASAIETLQALSGLDVPEPAADGAACRSCAHLVPPAVSWCPACALHVRIGLEPGPCWVRLRACELPSEHGAHLVASFGRARTAQLTALAEGRRASVLLARGVSRSTAEALAGDARRFGGAGEVGDGHGWLQLGEPVSASVVALGAGALATLGLVAWNVVTGPLSPWAHANQWALGGAFFGSTALLGGLLLWLASRPVLPRRVTVPPARPRLDAGEAAVASRVARLHARGTRRHAPVVASWQEARRACSAKEVAESLDAVVHAALDVTSKAARLEELLDARGDAEAARDLHRARSRATRAQRAQEGEGGAAGSAGEQALVAALEEEVLALEEADRALSAAGSRIVLATSLLRRIALRPGQPLTPEVESLLERARAESRELDAIAGEVEGRR